MRAFWPLHGGVVRGAVVVGGNAEEVGVEGGADAAFAVAPVNDAARLHGRVVLGRGGCKLGYHQLERRLLAVRADRAAAGITCPIGETAVEEAISPGVERGEVDHLDAASVAGGLVNVTVEGVEGEDLGQERVHLRRVGFRAGREVPAGSIGSLEAGAAVVVRALARAEQVAYDWGDVRCRHQRCRLH